MVFCFHNVDGCKGKGKEQVVKVSDDDGKGNDDDDDDLFNIDLFLFYADSFGDVWGFNT